MKNSNKGFSIPAFARLLFSVLILIFLFLQIDLTNTWTKITSANLWWLLAGALLMLSEPLMLSYWWSSMLSQKGYKTSTISVLRISLVSDFLGLVMPTSLGSDFVKVAGLSKYISSISEALSSLLVFRLLNYCVMFLLALFTLLIFPDYFPDSSAIAALRNFLIVGFLLLLAVITFAKNGIDLIKWVFTQINAQEVYRKVHRFYEGFSYFKTNRRELAKAFVAGTVIQFERIIFIYIIGCALQIDVGLAPYFVFVPIVTAITLLPVSISGIGVREGGYVLLFGYLGVPAAEAFSLSIIGFAVSLITIIPGGLIYWASGFPAPEKLESMKTRSEI
ncbi:MAG TPA: lysylphosphatidylglycerol synthase transmembrane domain-containing protein [Nitrospinota bacterium]|nr:lysylphosphatidylglycerol synthase transmembrane domain-containing protein [Nitrospinota bacterium]|tara:strand:+ start:90679 stop:91680 length:1002 start_codon:yes stop_codon:yes gene_type:complete